MRRRSEGNARTRELRCFLHPHPFSSRSRRGLRRTASPFRSRRRRLPSSSLVSRSTRWFFVSPVAVPVAPTSRLGRSLFALVSISLSLSHPRAALPVAAARLASLVHRLSPLEPRVGAGTAANTRYRRSAASRTSLLPFERTVAAVSLSVATRSSRGADRGRFVVSLHRSSQRARPRIIARTRFSLPVSTEREKEK